MSFAANLARHAVSGCLGFAVVASAGAQTYRETYPLGNLNSLGGLSLNLNIHDPSDTQLQQIQDAGFKYVRYELTWGGIEAQKGVYNWAVTDRFMARAKAHGLRVVMLLAFSNPLYTSTGAPNTDAARAGFAAYAAAAAARYIHQGVVWEIYNEPNLASWWPNPNPTDYAALVTSVVRAIRAVSSDEWIIGLTTEILRANNSTYINAALDGGILTSLDGIGFHPYTDVGPETMTPQWDTVRSLIEAKRPTGRPIVQVAGEVGYARAWSGITTTVQATYLARLVLYNLTQSIPLTNLYSYDDVVSDISWQNTEGITARGTNVPYPAYYAIQRLTRSLGSYRFSKRLNLASDADYALLFSNPSNPNDVRLAVWTTGASHTVSIPSSVAAFDGTDLTSGATSVATATTAGLSLPATGEVGVYVSRVPNPALGLAASWGTMPGSVTFANRSDAVSQLGDLVVSPAWAGTPAGSTLKIEDVPATAPGYARPSYTATLSNLPSLTLNSAAVQTVFNSLGALQDEQNAKRTLTLTLQLPDGSSIKQSASVLRKQPFAVYPTTPQSGALTLRLENPSGSTFNGSIKTTVGVSSQTTPVEFAQGETSKMMYFPSLTTNLLANGVVYGLYDASGNVLVSSDPAVGSLSQTVYRLPNFTSGAAYSTKVTGTSSVSGSGSLAFGTANWQFLSGTATADITYSFGLGSWKSIMLNAPSSVAATTFDKQPIALGMWVYGDGSANFIRAQFMDATNQTFQFTGGSIDWTGWKWVSIPISGSWAQAQYWGGANDGVPHGAIRCICPFILDSNQQGSTGKVSLAGITIVGQK